MKEPLVTEALAREHGLTGAEFARVVAALGRTPTFTELGVVSVMWSEHCSYRSSKRFLRTLPTAGPRVVEGPGENAGVIDAGEGVAIAFKMESHNHPSFIEPRQGAATGVGGILRDIFTMNARPIALADALRFGPLDHPATGAKSRYLFEGVVHGISSYGNAIGVPTVAGDVKFHESYARNPLVNVMAVGVGHVERIFRARASGVGNPVLYLGARTGRDGIHGATMASAGFDEKSEERRPTVQMGDPFTEKLLLEATLEILAGDAVVGIQDMGAAGLTCSTVEMGHRGGVGIEIDLDRVPQRESAMTAYELMLSESQERMLLVARRGREAEVIAVARKWGLCCEVVGSVIAERRARVRFGGEVVVDLPTDLVVDGAPTEEVSVGPFKPDDGFAETTMYGNGEALLAKLTDPGTASKEWVYRQYDHTVRAGTIVPPGAAGAAVIRIPGTSRAFAIAVGDSVYEAALAVACVGAEPVAITNCLNFGSPKDRGVLTDFARVVDAISRQCQAFGVPVTGGNVSFYNETDGTPIPPTPVIGMLGLIENARRHVTTSFKRPGDRIALVNGSFGEAPKVSRFLVAASRLGLLSSAHAVGDDGIEVALAESCILGKVGCDVLAQVKYYDDNWVVISCDPGHETGLGALAEEIGIRLSFRGTVGGDRLLYRRVEPWIDLPVGALDLAWRTAIPRLMRGA